MSQAKTEVVINPRPQRRRPQKQKPKQQQQNRSESSKSRDPRTPQTRALSKRAHAWGMSAIATDGPYSDTNGGRQRYVPRSIEDAYVACLASPIRTMCRVPQSCPRPTALVRSQMTFDITVDTNLATDPGRFSLCVQPTFGNLRQPDDYKVALATTGIGAWPVNFNTPTSYAAIVAGSDVRLDPFYFPLTRPSDFAYALVGGAFGGANGPPFGATPVLTAAQTYGITVQYTSTATTSVFALPVGVYNANLWVFGTTLGAIAVTGSTCTVVSNAPANSTDLTMAVSTIYFQVTAPGQTLVVLLTNAAITQSSFRIAPAFLTTGYAANDDNGIVTEYRPVACSVLASYVGPTLTNGGNIAAACIPGNAAVTNYFTNGSPTVAGQFQDWQALSRVPMSYNGEIKDGAYAWWSPEDFADTEFLRPGAALDHTYPNLVVSGVYTPGSTVVGLSTIIRINIVSVYEFTTPSLLHELKTIRGSQAMMDRAFNLLQPYSHAMKNNSHDSFFSDVLKTLGGVATGAAIPALAALLL
jgi:hypothetical protein